MMPKSDGAPRTLDVEGVVAELVGVEAALEQTRRRLVRTTDTLGGIARAAALPSEALDVERLARALHMVKIAGYGSVDFCEGGERLDPEEVDHVGDAESLIAEYARLSPSSDTREPTP